ncbi:glycosyltransferase family 4 protein [Haloarcula salinisoli]|uniref:Glycosyltransferase family 4 protein n=1 Tax=Haloarcula salinisoli TaxID=2487746 RepID=A0A8J7YRP0_9EURY|nr:glycosyltransferase family 4 protein [Halomicroarcula salinisoli]MBX0288793.1 glycosyltransferase family 4 protein [Halomicroarcula salinisoli]MBX0306068.1 glycosyltransferase family 4 protein [Halomicroarcula salinisoli]
MKVAHVYDEHYAVSPEKGSVAKVIYNVATSQSELGHDVSVLERQWDGLPRSETRDGVDFHRFRLRVGSDEEGEEIPYAQIKSPVGLPKLLTDRLEFALKLRRHFKRTDYDIIHFHLPFTANILVHLYPEIRERLVYTAHAGEVRLGLMDDQLLSRLLSTLSPDLHLMNRAEVSTVLNEDLATALPPELEVVPNGVDIQEYRPDKADLVDLTDSYNIEPPFMLFVGTITPRKGPDILLDAIDMLAERDVLGEMTFVLSGNKTVDESFSEEIAARVEQLDADIRLTGFVSLSELKALYAQCDAFILPSREEGWGMVATEAMASGVAIVGSDITSIRAQVRDGENGFLVPPENASALADAMEQLLTDDELKQRMGERSRTVAVEEFSWESIAQQYIDLYWPVVGY